MRQRSIVQWRWPILHEIATPCRIRHPDADRIWTRNSVDEQHFEESETDGKDTQSGPSVAGGCS